MGNKLERITNWKEVSSPIAIEEKREGDFSLTVEFLVHNSLKNSLEKFSEIPATIILPQNLKVNQLATRIKLQVLNHNKNVQYEVKYMRSNPPLEVIDDYLTQPERVVDFLEEKDTIQVILQEQNNGIKLPKIVKQQQITLQEFEIIRPLGNGGFSTVFLVRKKCSGTLYALKTLEKKRIKETSKIESVINERDIYSRVNHPFIVSMHCSFQTKKYLFFLLDFCSGGELFYHIQKNQKFTEEQARFIFAEVVLALEYLHDNNIIYRDLKPENVLFDCDGHARLADFGLSKINFTVDDYSSSFCGSPEYMSPEMLINGSQHNRMVDFYSLGCLLYEMILGIPPYYSNNRQTMYQNKINAKQLEFPNDFSKDLISLLSGLLHRNPKKRLGSNLGMKDIKAHSYCKSIDWEKFLKKEIDPPYKPSTRNSNFDLQSQECLIYIDLIKYSQKNNCKSIMNSSILFKDKSYERRSSDPGFQSLKKQLQSIQSPIMPGECTTSNKKLLKQRIIQDSPLNIKEFTLFTKIKNQMSITEETPTFKDFNFNNCGSQFNFQNACLLQQGIIEENEDKDSHKAQKVKDQILSQLDGINKLFNTKTVKAWQIKPKDISELQSFTNIESFTTNQDDITSNIKDMIDAKQMQDQSNSIFQIVSQHKERVFSFDQDTIQKNFKQLENAFDFNKDIPIYTTPLEFSPKNKKNCQTKSSFSKISKHINFENATSNATSGQDSSNKDNYLDQNQIKYFEILNEVKIERTRKDKKEPIKQKYIKAFSQQSSGKLEKPRSPRYHQQEESLKKVFLEKHKDETFNFSGQHQLTRNKDKMKEEEKTLRYQSPQMSMAQTSFGVYKTFQKIKQDKTKHNTQLATKLHNSKSISNLGLLHSPSGIKLAMASQNAQKVAPAVKIINSQQASDLQKQWIQGNITPGQLTVTKSSRNLHFNTQNKKPASSALLFKQLPTKGTQEVYEERLSHLTSQRLSLFQMEKVSLRQKNK